MEKVVETRQGRFTIRPYCDADEESVLALWESAFEKPLPISIWRWKYADNPYGKKIYLCVRDDGLPVVLYGGIPYHSSWKGEKSTIAQLMDVMAHPDYRGWLYIKTAKAYFDSCRNNQNPAFLYGLPGERAYVIGKKLLKYRKLGDGLLFLRSAPGAIKGKRNHWGRRIDLISTGDRRINGLWKRCEGDYPFSVIRDTRFVDWRFGRNPVNNYEIWGYLSRWSNRLLAYAACRHEGRVTLIVDFFSVVDTDAIADFLGKLSAELKERKMEIVETWLPYNHIMTKGFMGSGFEVHPEPFGFIPVGRSFHPDLTLEWVNENIYYTMADGDLL